MKKDFLTFTLSMVAILTCCSIMTCMSVTEVQAARLNGASGAEYKRDIICGNEEKVIMPRKDDKRYDNYEEQVIEKVTVAKTGKNNIKLPNSDCVESYIVYTAPKDGKYTFKFSNAANSGRLIKGFKNDYIIENIGLGIFNEDGEHIELKELKGSTGNFEIITKNYYKKLKKQYKSSKELKEQLDTLANQYDTFLNKSVTIDLKKGQTISILCMSSYTNTKFKLNIKQMK